MNPWIFVKNINSSPFKQNCGQLADKDRVCKFQFKPYFIVIEGARIEMINIALQHVS